MYTISGTTNHMRITLGFRKLVPSILSGAFGVALIIYGGNDGDPGVQLLGLIILTVSVVVMVKTRRKIICDIQK